MLARRLSIESLGARVILETIGDFDLCNLLLSCDISSRIIPCMQVQENSEGSKADMIIRHQGSEWSVEMGDRRWFTGRLPDISSLAEGILESRRQLEKGVCAVHGSLVCKEREAILIVGGSDCGKTSLALELRKHGWDFLTDEKTLIRLPEGEAVGGLRAFRVQRHLAEQGCIAAQENAWIQLGPWPPENPTLTCVVYVNLLPHASEPIKWEISPKDACWELYPEFSKSISVPRHFGDFASASAGFDSDDLASWRAAATRLFCNRCKLLHLGGRADHAAKSLNDVVGTLQRANPIASALRFLRACKTNEGYSLSVGGTTTTMSTCFAVLALSLVPNNAVETNRWQREIAQRLDSLFHPATCLYRDPLIDPAEVISTLHPIDYLEDQTDYFVRRSLRSLCRHPHRNRFSPCKWSRGDVWSCLQHLDWSDPWLASNRAMFLLSRLEEEANWGDPLALMLREEALDWMEAIQDPETGLWGTDLGSGILRGVAGAYHLAPFVLSSGRTLRHTEKIVDSVLSLEHPNGLFYPVVGGCACVDTDCAGLLAWLLPYTSRKRDVRETLRRTKVNLLKIQLIDGGFPESGATAQDRSTGAKAVQKDKIDQTWITPTRIRYSSWHMMEYATDVSDCWSTYFRLLAIAFCDLALGPSPSEPWCLEDLPGLAWWPKGGRI